MLKFLFAVVLFFTSTQLFSQHQLLAFKKKGKTIKTYSSGEYIAFLQQNKQWEYGILTRISRDSFYIRTYVLQRGFSHIDTISYFIIPYSIADVFAMPKPGIAIEEFQGPKTHQINMNAGHVHFYWIKGGWIFRALGIGYAGLNIINAVFIENQSIDWAGLGYAAGLFALGELLKYTYRPYLKLGKKYSLELD